MLKHRKIIHIDMDAFYASVEQRDNPEYKNKPIVVGGLGARGVVAAASYEARKYGIFSAMSGKMAKRKCPFVIFVKPRFKVYKAVSKQIRSIFHEYTDLVEPLSLDEAYLDVTRHKKGKPSATLIAIEIKKRIKSELNLTASAGISINKFLAKVASDYKKPDGLFLIKPEDAESFVEKLPIEKFFGVGKVTAQKMHKLRISNGLDLKALSLNELIKHFGKQGAYFYNIARAIDNREVQANRVRKSVGVENTFETDIDSRQEMLIELKKLSKTLYERLQGNKYFGRTVSLKIKFSDFKQITRSKTYNSKIDSYELLWNAIVQIFNNTDLNKSKVRLLGASVSNAVLHSDGKQAMQLTFDF